MKLLEDSFIIDGCIYPANDFTGAADDILESGLNAFFLTIPFSHKGFRESIRSIGEIYNLTDDGDKKLKIARNVSELENNRKNNQLSIILYFQDAISIENNINHLRVFYELGLRVIQLTYNQGNYIGSGCAELNDGGLTNFGKKVVKEMNRLGILVDLSHCSKRTAMEAIEESDYPCVFSHANIKAIADNPRNKTDEELKLLAERGGVIGITPWAPICWKGKVNEQPTIEDYLDHLDYAVDLIGIDHVAFASDGNLDHSTNMTGIMLQKTLSPSIVGRYNSNIGMDPDIRHAKGLKGAHNLDNLIEGLYKRNYRDEDIKKILGSNFKRVIKKVWK